MSRAKRWLEYVWLMGHCIALAGAFIILLPTPPSHPDKGEEWGPFAVQYVYSWVIYGIGLGFLAMSRRFRWSQAVCEACALGAFQFIFEIWSSFVL